MDAPEIRQKLLKILLKQFEQEMYPSATMMNRIEVAMETRQQVEAYAEALLDKIASTRFPSIPMLNRLDAVLTTLE
jgi:hypothetical protein